MTKGQRTYLKLGFGVLIFEIIAYWTWAKVIKPCYNSRVVSLQEILSNDL
jgi:hypothetical protein